MSYKARNCELTLSEDPLVQIDENLQLEQDVFVPLSAARKLYVYETKDFWRQIKTAASAITASALYLNQYKKTHPDLLAKGDNLQGPVYVDSTAHISPSAKVGPNVAIGPGVVVNDGARIANAIVMEGSVIDKHAVVINSIVGSNCRLGQWARVDGEPEPVTEVKGQISVSVLASETTLAPETHVRSCIVLPNVSLVLWVVLTRRNCSTRAPRTRFSSNCLYFFFVALLDVMNI